MFLSLSIDCYHFLQISSFQTSLPSHVDEVDIFPGAICENNVAGGMVGPTFACILGRQFRNLRVADRFWYENSEPNTGFTRGEIVNWEYGNILLLFLCTTFSFQNYIFSTTC